jgi:hypothetical protein
MAISPHRDAEPQQTATGVVKVLTFDAFEQLPPGKSTREERMRLTDRNSIGDDLVEMIEVSKPKGNGRVTTQELRHLNTCAGAKHTHLVRPC